MKKPKATHSDRSKRHEEHNNKGLKNPKNYNAKKSHKKAWIIAGVVLLVLIVAGLVVYAKVQSTLGEMNQVEVDTSDLDANQNYKEVVNIALYGIDSSDTESGRSDAIMILTLDPNNKVVKITSIMRDSYVNIEGHGMDKINHAYAFGGPELAMKTLNQNFGLNITSFMAVDFTSLPEIIDQLGGVTIDITAEEAATGAIPGITSAGTYNLSGAQALAYSRIRHAAGNDFQRTERQRTVLDKLMITIMKQPSSTWPSIVAQVAPYITTNLSPNDIIGLATTYGGYAKQGIRQLRFPRDGECEGQYIDSIYYLVFDIPTVSQEMQDYLFHDITPE